MTSRYLTVVKSSPVPVPPNKLLRLSLMDSAEVLLPRNSVAVKCAAEPGRYAAEDTLPLAGKAGSICRRRDSARSVRYCPKVALSATGFAGYLRTRYAPTFSCIR